MFTLCKHKKRQIWVLALNLKAQSFTVLFATVLCIDKGVSCLFLCMAATIIWYLHDIYHVCSEIRVLFAACCVLYGHVYLLVCAVSVLALLVLLLALPVQPHLLVNTLLQWLSPHQHHSTADSTTPRPQTILTLWVQNSEACPTVIVG